jgi:hypothetical protein
MPKPVNRQVVINTIAEAVRRGLLALRYLPPGGGEDWFWHCPIEGVVDWADFSEVWLPGNLAGLITSTEHFGRDAAGKLFRYQGGLCSKSSAK